VIEIRWSPILRVADVLGRAPAHRSAVYLLLHHGKCQLGDIQKIGAAKNLPNRIGHYHPATRCVYWVIGQEVSRLLRPLALAYYQEPSNPRIPRMRGLSPTACADTDTRRITPQNYRRFPGPQGIHFQVEWALTSAYKAQMGQLPPENTHEYPPFYRDPIRIRELGRGFGFALNEKRL
jgi:hypothetical protein